MVCCYSRAACIEAENKQSDGTWKKVYGCSLQRGMNGVKIVKIILIPAIFLIVDILFVAFMAMKCDIGGSHVTKLCVLVIGVSWPILFSEKWVYGAYSAIIALFVAFMSESAMTARAFPWWIYRLSWAMAAFQVILLLGPTESFHVPFYRQSEAGTSTNLVKNVLAITEAGCNTYFEGFFKLTGSEQAAKKVDPTTEYYGLCAIGWLSFVQIMLVIQSIIWFVIVLVSLQGFLSLVAVQKAPKVVKPKPAPEQKVESGKSGDQASPAADPNAVTPVTPVEPVTQVTPVAAVAEPDSEAQPEPSGAPAPAPAAAW